MSCCHNKHFRVYDPDLQPSEWDSYHHTRNSSTDIQTQKYRNKANYFTPAILLFPAELLLIVNKSFSWCSPVLCSTPWNTFCYAEFISRSNSISRTDIIANCAQKCMSRFYNTFSIGNDIWTYQSEGYKNSKIFTIAVN